MPLNPNIVEIANLQNKRVDTVRLTTMTPALPFCIVVNCSYNIHGLPIYCPAYKHASVVYLSDRHIAYALYVERLVYVSFLSWSAVIVFSVMFVVTFAGQPGRYKTISGWFAANTPTEFSCVADKIFLSYVGQ